MLLLLLFLLRFIVAVVSSTANIVFFVVILTAADATVSRLFPELLLLSPIFFCSVCVINDTGWFSCLYCLCCCY